jgi:hypothetical protein
MRNSKRIFWLRASQLLASLFAGIAFACFWVPWMTSQTAEDAIKQYPGKVDASWRAVNVSHSHVSEWRLGTPRQNPIAFGLCTSFMLLAAIYGAAIGIWIERHKGDSKSQMSR